MSSAHQGASRGRRLGGWLPAGAGPKAVVQADASTLIRRSRDLKRNNPQARRALELISTHTVGTGIVPRPLCSDRETRERITDLWSEWTDVADADGVLDFYGLQNLAVSEMAEGGESFGRLRIRRLSDNLPVPLQVQLIPTEQVPLGYSAQNGKNTVQQGVERTPFGKRAAIWMYPAHPGDGGLDWRAQDMRPRRIPASEVVHLYNVMRIGQIRGLPWLAAAITTLQQAGAYLDAELLRKQMVASIVGFIKRTAGPDMDPQDLAKAWGEVMEQFGELPAVAMEPGTMQALDFNEDVVFNNPADVGTSFEPFLAATYRSAAVAAGVLYEELTGNWKDVNDRTFRAQFNTFKRQVQQWQWHLVAYQFNRPIWNTVIRTAIAAGRLRLSAGVTEADALRVEWRPQRWDYINPKQDVEATLLEVDGGLTSRQAAVADRGDDVEVVDRQRQADAEREARLDLQDPLDQEP